MTVCYNVVNDIEKTILSVINQTYPRIEYLIIEGGSIDGTMDVGNKNNMMAMLLGIICVFIASILKSTVDNQYFVIACNAVIFAVLIMYLHLIVDIAMAFFRIIEN